MNTAIIITVVLLVIVCLLAYKFDKSSRDNDLLAEQFNADFLHTRSIMPACTRKDAEKLIDAFYQRWHGLIAEWVICAHVRNLQTYLDYEHPHIYQISKN